MEVTLSHEKDETDCEVIDNQQETGMKEIQEMKEASKIFDDNNEPQLDTTMERISEDHYVYRRGSISVHIQTLLRSTTNEFDFKKLNENQVFEGMKMISVLLGIILFVITLAIKMAAAISDKASGRVVDQYMLTLYVSGTLWIFCYIVKSCFQNQNKATFLKSGQRSNWWLKGVIVLFGFAILLRNGLAFISYLMVDLSQCSLNNTKIAISVFQALFVIMQTKFLFQYSKVFIRSGGNGFSPGLMMVIVVNLSTWLSTVIDGTLHALRLGSINHQDSPHATQSYNSTTTAILENRAGPPGHKGDPSCECTTEFCDAARTADTFLFPFLIEYSLVASSLIYITWENMGKSPPPCEQVIKPSYKFYGRYRGSLLGLVVMSFTIVFMILLATSSSEVPLPDKNYFSETSQLVLYDSFLTGLELLMSAATIFGLCLFHKLSRPLQHTPHLDQILLVGCLLGPLVINCFSLIAVISGSENKTTFWMFTLLQPLIDLLQCIMQSCFVLFGLRRKPITSSFSKETVVRLISDLEKHFLNPSQVYETSFANKSFANEIFVGTRKHSLAHCSIEKDPEDVSDCSNSCINEDSTTITSSSFQNLKENGVTIAASTAKRNNQPITKIVSEVHVACPEGLRLWLRDVIMFLLVSNVCLWVFLSLSGTVFVIFQYQTEFFGGSGWTTISMLCRPLTIFFRMHSAGCLFELWSFA